MCAQSPTSVRNGKTYYFITMDNMQLGMRPFGEEAQKKNHEGLGLEWTISYQCIEGRVHEVSQ